VVAVSFYETDTDPRYFVFPGICVETYIWEMMASPNLLQETSVAPSIRRAKS